MHILLTTYGLLLIFALYCSAQWRSAIDMAFMDTIAIERFADFRKNALNKVNDRSKKEYKKYAPKNPKPTSKAVSSKVNSSESASSAALITDEDEDEEEEALIESPDEPEDNKSKKNTDTTRTPHLHVGFLFTGDTLSITEGKGKAGFTLLKNLMATMYSGQKFYEEAKEAVPEFEEEFLRNLIERAKEEQEDKQWVSKFGHLGAIELNDKLQSYIRYKMFTGNKSRLTPGSEHQPGYFPLVEFTSIRERNTIMSIWRAPRTILMALFQDPEIVNEIIEVRREMHKDVRKDHSTQANAAKETDLRLRFGALIPDQSLVQYIDFQVCTTAPPRDDIAVIKPKQRQKK